MALRPLFGWWLSAAPLGRLHGLPPQLSAGGVDVAPQLPAHRDGDPLALQALLEGGHPAAGLQGALLHMVQGDQVYVSRRALQVPGQQIRLPVGVVHPVDHGVLVGDAPAGLFKIPAAGGKELLHPDTPVHRHDPAPGLVVRRVQGHRQR